MARTREEIIADCEEAYKAIETALERPQNKFPCNSCRWYSMKGDDGHRWGADWPQYHTCVHPLVKGIRLHGVRLENNQSYGPFPCGIEKALWEKPLTWKDKLIAKLGR